MQDKLIATGLTFDDVLIEPRYSDVVPSEVERRHAAHAADRDARADPQLADGHGHRARRWPSRLAQEGGLGVIHKNMSIERQTEEVDKVKRSANGIIVDPVTLPPTLASLPRREMMQQSNVSRHADRRRRRQAGGHHHPPRSAVSRSIATLRSPR